MTQNSEFPLFIVVIWPILFAVIEVISTILLSDKQVAKGEKKYRVTFKEKAESENNAEPISTAPVTMEYIIQLYYREKITEIKRLVDRRLHLFSFGLDLCIGAIATDLSLAAATVDPTTDRFIALAALHFLMFAVVLFVLWASESRTRAVLSADLIGILSITSMFLFLGGQVAQ